MKPTRILGVGLALLVPAIAVAFTVPNTFNSGDPITAAKMNANFAALATDVTDLRTLLATTQNSLATVTSDLATTKTELATAKADLATAKTDITKFRGAFGSPVTLTSITSGDADVSYTAKSSGHFVAFPNGSGWGKETTTVRVGSLVGGRAQNGGSVTAPVTKDQTIQITVDFNGTTTSSVALYWYPLESGGAAPQ